MRGIGSVGRKLAWMGLLATWPWAAAWAAPGVDFMQAGPARLDVAVWYPSAAPDVVQQLGPFSIAAASSAPVLGHGLPLVVISHGSGGSLLSHADTALALAQAGFVVVSLTHAGDNYRDHSRELQLQDRPPQVSAALDAVLTQWRGRAAIDPARIGVFGFSAGGFTALVLIGGKPDLHRVAPYCATHAQTFVCTMRQRDADEVLPAAPAFAADPRIKAAVIAAPALGFSFGRDGLRQVAVPVQLWAAANDTVLPVADNAGAVRADLPAAPDYHLVPGAVHLDFLAPCPAALAAAVPAICAEPTKFDRAGFHVAFNAAVVRFFQTTLMQAARP